MTTLWTPIDATQPTFVSQLQGGRVPHRDRRQVAHGRGRSGHDPKHFDYWDVLIDQGEYVDPRFLSPDGIRNVEGYATDVITDLAIDWVESLEGDEPWCLLIWHKAPHRPWEPDEKHQDMYSDPIPVPGTFWDDYSTRSASARRALMRIVDYLNTEDLKVDPAGGLELRGARRCGSTSATCRTTCAAWHPSTTTSAG